MVADDQGERHRPHHGVQAPEVVRQQRLDDEKGREEGCLQHPVKRLGLEVSHVGVVQEGVLGAGQPEDVAPPEALVGGVGVQRGVGVLVVVPGVVAVRCAVWCEVSQMVSAG